MFVVILPKVSWSCLWRGCTNPLVQHILCGGYRRSLHAFQGGQRHHGRSGAPWNLRGLGGLGVGIAGEPSLASSLWDMLYADDAGVVSPPTEQVKMMSMILVVCAAVGLTVSKAKTEIMC